MLHNLDSTLARDAVTAYIGEMYAADPESEERKSGIVLPLGQYLRAMILAGDTVNDKFATHLSKLLESRVRADVNMWVDHATALGLNEGKFANIAHVFKNATVMALTGAGKEARDTLNKMYNQTEDGAPFFTELLYDINEGTLRRVDTHTTVAKLDENHLYYLASVVVHVCVLLALSNDKSAADGDVAAFGRNFAAIVERVLTSNRTTSAMLGTLVWAFTGAVHRKSSSKQPFYATYIDYFHHVNRYPNAKDELLDFYVFIMGATVAGLVGNASDRVLHIAVTKLMFDHVDQGKSSSHISYDSMVALFAGWTGTLGTTAKLEGGITPVVTEDDMELYERQDRGVVDGDLRAWYNETIQGMVGKLYGTAEECVPASALAYASPAMHIGATYVSELQTNFKPAVARDGGTTATGVFLAGGDAADDGGTLVERLVKERCTVYGGRTHTYGCKSEDLALELCSIAVAVRLDLGELIGDGGPMGAIARMYAATQFQPQSVRRIPVLRGSKYTTRRVVENNWQYYHCLARDLLHLRSLLWNSVVDAGRGERRTTITLFKAMTYAMTQPLARIHHWAERPIGSISWKDLANLALSATYNKEAKLISSRGLRSDLFLADVYPPGYTTTARYALVDDYPKLDKNSKGMIEALNSRVAFTLPRCFPFVTHRGESPYNGVMRIYNESRRIELAFEELTGSPPILIPRGELWDSDVFVYLPLIGTRSMRLYSSPDDVRVPIVRRLFNEHEDNIAAVLGITRGVGHKMDTIPVLLYALHTASTILRLATFTTRKWTTLWTLPTHTLPGIGQFIHEYTVINPHGYFERTVAKQVALLLDYAMGVYKVEMPQLKHNEVVFLLERMVQFPAGLSDELADGLVGAYRRAIAHIRTTTSGFDLAASASQAMPAPVAWTDVAVDAPPPVVEASAAPQEPTVPVNISDVLAHVRLAAISFDEEAVRRHCVTIADTLRQISGRSDASAKLLHNRVWLARSITLPAGTNIFSSWWKSVSASGVSVAASTGNMELVVDIDAASTLLDVLDGSA